MGSRSNSRRRSESRGRKAPSRRASRSRSRSDSRRPRRQDSRSRRSRTPPKRRGRSPSNRRKRSSSGGRRSRSPRSRDKKYKKLPDDFADKRFYGTMRMVNKGSGFGFISCPETRAEFGRDVFVDLNRLPPSCDREGDKVSFKLVVGRKGYAEATGVERA
ncbi:hypothetical protein AK812_SmicGene33497 [Symbiodinium microadriaticum]|uniref:CSD domain-containing protein n=1 Tax=Symbiodinium microadriaticum TaxID=2951 RepID=A0A1Q9CRI6_SYMMI|nr:hypothetical protein AK812_SmicGene33497 [Symbiodinium microadriaticum]